MNMIPTDLTARMRQLSEASFFEADQPVNEPNRVRGIPGDVLQPGRSSLRTEPDAAPALSRIGRLIGTLLSGPPTAKVPPLEAGQPLLAAPPETAEPLALALDEAVRRSGLFYESHLSQWMAGDFSTAALRQEPQASARTPRAGGVPDALLPLVSRQLDALATHQFAWQAQPWPGQDMEWQLEDLARGHFPNSADAAWSTTLRLALPRLGEVEASLRFGAEGLHVQVLSGNPGARAALEANREALGQSLGYARLSLLDLSVEPADGAP